MYRMPKVCLISGDCILTAAGRIPKVADLFVAVVAGALVDYPCRASQTWLTPRFGWVQELLVTRTERAQSLSMSVLVCCCGGGDECTMYRISKWVE
jgi:hypothetical protein